ncbi:hypothetical protein [uncultured Thalassospira sp.]|uniref:hypothetical protein n=1 Tax=uncultured Thalassospira sp. TaxID=404382 RepID=UPI0030D92D1F
MEFFEGVASGTLATIIGGIFSAVVFFLVREKFFAYKDISGKWKYYIITEKTEYKPYQGMKLTYAAVLWREGDKIYGSVEKVYEKSSTGERSYVGKNRTTGVVTGSYEKKYFGRDRINIHVREKGQERESTVYFSLYFCGGKMQGRFDSFVADQFGRATWER